MRTKDEIFKPRSVIVHGEKVLNERMALEAMDEYAKEVAMLFHRWAYENHYSKYWGSDKPNNQKWYKSYTPPTRTYYTDEELFEIFKTETNIQ